MEIRRSKVKTLSGSLKPKKIFCLLYLNLFLGKINVLKNHTQITYLIKGTVSGRALWGLLTPSPHVTDSRTWNPFSQTCLILFLVFHSFPLINYGGDSIVLKKQKIIFLFAVPVVAPIATENNKLIPWLDEIRSLY